MPNANVPSSVPSMSMQRHEEMLHYIGGPLDGRMTLFPVEGMVLDGVYEECPEVDGQYGRYVLRRHADGWALVYAGPRDDPHVVACAGCGSTMPNERVALTAGWLRRRRRTS